MGNEADAKMIEAIREAAQKLKDDGFEHIATVMADGKGYANYGMVFLHPGGRKIYLNKQTVRYVLTSSLIY